MKILYVNNYFADKSSFDACINGEWSLAHTWGGDMLYKTSGVHFSFESSQHIAKRKNRVLRLMLTLFFQFKLLLKYYDYDCVYGACAHCVDIFGLGKKLNFFKGILIAIIHHPTKILLSKHYDLLVCFSKYTYNLLVSRYPFANICYKFWGPHIPFYEAIKSKLDNDTINEHYDFFSNGKSFRDFPILEQALIETNYTALVIRHGNAASKNMLCKDARTQSESLKFSNRCKVMIVPVIKQKGVCGVTSINDALGMGMPILLSSSCNLGFDPQEQGIGYVYEAGNVDDLKDKMRLILQDEVLHKLKQSLSHFRERNDYIHFSKFIYDFVMGKCKI